MLNLFGLFSVVLMLVTYWLEDEHPAYILGFAISCALGGLYAILQGAWPFAIAEGVWAVLAYKRWKTVSTKAAP